MASDEIPDSKTTKKSRHKTSTRRKTSSKRKINSPIGGPDTSVLAGYSPTGGADSHPDWVKRQFPTYVNPHTGHETTAIREFIHEGHIVKIITSYRVEVDGQRVHAHLSVDENGQVYTHATPFVTYASAVDLMKAVIDSYPESFSRKNVEHEEHHDIGHPGEGI